jgi:hypothetical protein
VSASSYRQVKEFPNLPAIRYFPRFLWGKDPIVVDVGEADTLRDSLISEDESKFDDR